jgi:hypothetical protein
VTGRDWKQIEAELDDLKPGGSDEDPQTSEQTVQTTGSWVNEETILKHIADALRMDCSDTSSR